MGNNLIIDSTTKPTSCQKVQKDFYNTANSAGDCLEAIGDKNFFGAIKGLFGFMFSATKLTLDVGSCTLKGAAKLSQEVKKEIDKKNQESQINTLLIDDILNKHIAKKDQNRISK